MVCGSCFWHGLIVASPTCVSLYTFPEMSGPTTASRGVPCASLCILQCWERISEQVFPPNIGGALLDNLEHLFEKLCCEPCSFSELAGLLDPGKAVRTDKLSIIADAVRNSDWSHTRLRRISTSELE